jgi:hypothetical protein
MIAISSTTAKPQSASTHRFRYQGEEFSSGLNSSSLFAPRLGSLFELPSASYGGRLPPTGSDRIGYCCENTRAPERLQPRRQIDRGRQLRQRDL